MPEHVQDILLQLNELAKPAESLYEKIKILAVNEENPDRYELFKKTVPVLGVRKVE